jgi:spore coat polysaccharide biosynthesis protein SpsF
VVGLLNSNVVFIIQARMKSTRLPGKILMPLPLGSNKPLLSWIVESLKESLYYKKIFLATSENKENDVLIDFCNNSKIEIFRGDENNVLSRFTSIIKGCHSDCVVRLTADNPIIDTEILDKAITYHLSNNNDYTKTFGLPIGMNFEIIRSKALIKSESLNISEDDKEHVTLYLRNSDDFKKGVFTMSCIPTLKDLRLTVDYPSDFVLLSNILTQKTLNPNIKGGINLIEKTFQDYPWLFEINKLNIQKKQFTTIRDEINEACFLLNDFDFKKAASILEKYAKKNIHKGGR